MRGFTGIIFKKEMLDIFRDRRSIIMGLLLPIVLYPAMFWFIGSQTAAQIEGPSEVEIAADAGAFSNLLSIISDPVFDGSGINITSYDDPVDALRNGDADIAVLSELIPAGMMGFRVVHDHNRTSSFMAAQHITNLFGSYIHIAQAQALAEMGISLGALAPFTFNVVSLDAETGEEPSGMGMFLSIMLPMILVILLSVGGMATAVDLFAGEKERRTFEPLLCTGARRTDILAGKLWAVTVMSLLSALTSVAGMILGYVINPRAMTMGLDDAQGLALPLSTMLMIVLIIMAMAIFFSGLHILLSTYARTVKEASTYGSFVMIACYIPIFATMNMMGGDFKFWSAFVPVMNVTGCLKMVLAGINDFTYFGITLAVTAAFVLIVMIAGRYMFKKENIMLRA